jgi:hypothetical protein
LRPDGQSDASDAGYALLLLMMAVTLLLISLTVALPSVSTEAQRDREEELIFRGNEYARAIALFHSRFNRYPNSVDDLLKKTNGIRFLRRAYKDPMTKSGAWRFVHVSGAGMLLDSKTMNLQPAAGLKPNSSSSPDTKASASGSSPSAPASSPDDAVNADAGAQAASTDQAQGAQAQSGQQGQTSGGGFGLQSGQAPSSSSQFLSGNQVQGSFIAGVASVSKKRSIRVLNDKKRYDEWEFLGVALSSGMQPPAAPGGIGPGTGSGPQPSSGTNQGGSSSQGGQAPGPVQLVPPPQGQPAQPGQPQAPDDLLNAPQ